MTTRRRFIQGAAASGLAAALPARLARAQAQRPLRIGFSIAKTGIFAAAAPSQLNAYDLWRSEVNARGGLALPGARRTVEFVQYDDQSNPSQAARIYEKLITDDKVDLLLAPWGTPTHIAVAPVLERFRFPMIGNTAASAKLRELKPGNIWFVTAAFPDRVAAELTKMLQANGVKSVALVTNVLPFGKEIKGFLEPALKAAGIEVRVNEEYPPDIKDMTALLTKVKQAAPDAVLALSYPSDSPLYVRQAKELGIAAPFQFVMVGPGIDFFPKLLGAAANGIVTVGHWTPARNARAKAFYDAYVARFKERPDYLDSIESYVSCEVLEQAVAKAGTDRARLREAIAQGEFETINGKIRFKGVENVVTPTGFLQLQDGVLQQVWPSALATAQFRPKTGW
ncbi:MAG: amino acid ABC transporter substrate-binding protein [Burkholderiales bacterium]